MFWLHSRAEALAAAVTPVATPRSSRSTDSWSSATARPGAATTPCANLRQAVLKEFANVNITKYKITSWIDYTYIFKQI